MIMHCYEHGTQNPLIFFLQTGNQFYKSDVISHLEQGEQLSREGICFLQDQSPGELQEAVLQ